MTLILKFDLDMVKMYHHTKNEVSMSRHSKVISQTDTQTDMQTDRHIDSMKTLPSCIRGRKNEVRFILSIRNYPSGADTYQCLLLPPC